jgi:hypothetical protein
LNAEEFRRTYEQLMQQARAQWQQMGVDPAMMASQFEMSFASIQAICATQPALAPQMQEGLLQGLRNIVGMTSASTLSSMQAAAMAAAAELTKDDGDDSFVNSPPEMKEPSDLDDPADQAAVSCGANLGYLNFTYLNTLQTFRPQRQIKEMLENDWEITCVEELNEMLEWLSTQGHRAAMHHLYEVVRGSARAELAIRIENAGIELLSEGYSYESDQIQEFAVNLVAGSELLKSRGFFSTGKPPRITSWDLGRAVFLCRAGYDMEWFTKEETIERVRGFASALYREYGSWRELSEGYLLGFYAWSGDGDQLDLLLQQHEQLLTHEQSPWKKFGWPEKQG